MNIPTVPTFIQNESSLTNLQSLSAAVSMVSVAASYPMWRFYGTGTQSLTANTWNQLRVGSIAVDTDGVYSTPATTVTIKTQGYYECEACVPFEGNATPFLGQGVFLVTAGASNPHHISGATVMFGSFAGWAAYSTAGVDATYTMSGKCPWVLYPGDTIIVQVYPLATGNLNNGLNATATSGNLTPQFSGRWISMGS
jgi:hypothetical protein